jgi:hypothetical protein
MAGLGLVTSKPGSMSSLEVHMLLPRTSLLTGAKDRRRTEHLKRGKTLEDIAMNPKELF